MFDNAQEPKDMFDGIDTGAPAPTPPSATPPADASRTPTTPVMESASEGGIPWKPLLLGIAVLLVLGGAGAVTYLILSSRSSATPVTAEPQVTEPVEEPVEIEEPAPTPEPPAPPVVETPPDTDKDGLTDVQERELGTSSSSSDTDADGLFDREEVEVYKTNPLNADTDGDTYSDGSEVKNGYNPNGTGKLFEVPAAS